MESRVELTRRYLNRSANSSAASLSRRSSRTVTETQENAGARNVKSQGGRGYMVWSKAGWIPGKNGTSESNSPASSAHAR